MRQAVYAMMRWWLDRGVDGFRMDVINMISKDVAPDGHLHDGPPLPGSALGDGGASYICGPRIHEFLQEMHREVFAGRDAALLDRRRDAGGDHRGGQAVHRPGPRRGGHGVPVRARGLDQGSSKWDVRPLRLRDLKASFGRWQAGLADVGWNSLYWDNHDQPRAVSRFGDDCPGSGATPRPAWRRCCTSTAGRRTSTRGRRSAWRTIRSPPSTTSGTRVDQPLRDGDGRGRGPGEGARGDAADEPRQRPYAGAVGRHRARRLHHRDPVAAGESRPLRVERRRPARRPRVRARPLPAADRAAAPATRWSRSATSRWCCRSTSTCTRSPAPSTEELLLVVCNVSGTPYPLSGLLPEALDAELLLGNLVASDPAVLGPWEARVLRLP